MTTTKKDEKLAKMMAKMDKIADQKADLTPTATLNAEAKAKIRDKRISSYITADEKEQFISLIGRQSESDAVRELILTFIDKNSK